MRPRNQVRSGSLEWLADGRQQDVLALNADVTEFVVRRLGEHVELDTVAGAAAGLANRVTHVSSFWLNV